MTTAPKKNNNVHVWVVLIIASVTVAFSLCGGLAILATSASDERSKALTVESEPSAPATESSVNTQSTETVEAPPEIPLEIDVVDTYTDANSFGTKYTAVSVEVTNVSDARIYVGPLDWHATDVDGFKHDATYGPYGSRSERLPGLYLENDEATAGVFHIEGDVDVGSVAYQRWSHDDPIVVQVE